MGVNDFWICSTIKGESVMDAEKKMNALYTLSSPYVSGPTNVVSATPFYWWKARLSIIIDVLKNLDADILCLQELDEYDKFYKEKIEQNGYSSIYIKRTGRKLDGCGIFYKHSKLELVLEKKIDYNDLANMVLEESSHGEQEKALDTNNITRVKSPPSDRGDPNDPYVRLKRDCVGIMAAFKFKNPHQHYVIVANTHIYWDPEWADVKLAQAKYLLSCVDQFKKMILQKKIEEVAMATKRLKDLAEAYTLTTEVYCLG